MSEKDGNADDAPAVKEEELRVEQNDQQKSPHEQQDEEVAVASVRDSDPESIS